MDEFWGQDDPAKCDLKHPRNLERLLLSDAVIHEIMAAGNIPFSDPIRIMHLEQEVNPANMASAHPLRAIFKNIPKKIVSIKFILDRISDPNRPTSGQESFVKIQVLATVSSTLNTQISTTSFLGLYPRELNTFALILRGDILLNTDDFSSHAPNSVRFPLFASKAEAGKGIIFLSPVFTNHSLYLPDTKDHTDTRYNNITFGDKLVLAGSIFQNGEPFKPATLGHPSEQYFVQQTRFGGLSKGVDLDRIPDKGPEYLWDPNAVVDDSLMKLCILRTQRKMNLFWTQDAILVVKQPQPALIQGNKKTFNFRVGLSKKDEFKEASAHKIKVTSNNNNSTLITKISLDAKEIKKFSFPILRASIQFGDNNGPNDIVIAHLSPESDLNITLRGPSEPHLIIKTHAIATNQVGLEIQFTDPTKFPTPPKIKIYAYDFGTDADGNNLRDGKFGPNRVLAENTLTFAGGNQTDITGPAITADWSPLPISGFDRALSMQDLPKDGENPGDIQCNSGKNLAFATTDWNKDFSKSTRTSRIFNPPPLGEDLIFPDQAPEKDFHVYSIVKGKCVIKSTASVVAGFLTCNLLKIESRNSPLWIIGTVIAGSLDIAPEAIKAGIFWSNIYHPSAQSLLRAKGILKSTDGSACQDVPLEPFWSPVADSNLFAKMYSCLPIALLTADPFMWTTVDPVCGLEQGSSAVVCKIKNRPLNFLGVDFARWSTL